MGICVRTECRGKDECPHITPEQRFCPYIGNTLTMDWKYLEKLVDWNRARRAREQAREDR